MTAVVEDYLRFILEPFSNVTETDLSFENETTFYNTTDFFNANFTGNETNFEYFQSTLGSYFYNATAAEEDVSNNTVDGATISTFYYNDFSTTIWTTLRDFETTSYRSVNNATDCYSISCEDNFVTLSQTVSNNFTSISPTVQVKYSTVSTLSDVISPTKYDQVQNSTKSKNKFYCWETMFGQEIVKLTVMDLILTVLSVFFVDFFRAVFVRFMNRCWCWDLEKKFPQYGDFKIAENILHLVNNQGMVWMAIFFSPGILLINLFKLVIIMYLRSWAVLACNVPHEIIFRASRSNNFYFALLLTMLFLCVLPVGYAIVKIKPSSHCGPFAGTAYSYQIFTDTLKEILPGYMNTVLDYIASPGIIIPLLVLLILIIYYLISLTNSLREANNDLKIQLRRERTEERRKMFKFAERRRRAGSEGSGELATPFSKWKKILQNYPKSIDETTPTNKDSPEIPVEEKPVVKTESNRKDFLSKLIKKALRKPSLTSEEESMPNPQGDATDTEQQDSLPEDIISIKEAAAAVRRSKEKPTLKGTTTTTRRPLQVTSSSATTKGYQEENSKSSTPKKPNRRPKQSKGFDPSLQKTGEAATAQKRHHDTQKHPKEGFEPGESKHVKIKERRDSNSGHHHRRRDTFDIHKPEKSKPIYHHKSPSSSSKEFRQDSLTSNWSDNIPVITISKTESDECILGEKKQPQPKVVAVVAKKRPIIHQDATNLDYDSEATVKDVEGVVAEEVAEEVSEAEPAKIIESLVKQRFSFDRTEEELDTQTEESSKSERTTYERSDDVAGNAMASANRSSVKTESSADYKDDITFS